MLSNCNSEAKRKRYVTAYTGIMATVPNHSHCEYCGDPIRFGEKYCDEGCRELAEASEHAEKMKDLKFYGFIVVSLVAIFAVGMSIVYLR